MKRRRRRLWRVRSNCNWRRVRRWHRLCSGRLGSLGWGSGFGCRCWGGFRFGRLIGRGDDRLGFEFGHVIEEGFHLFRLWWEAVFVQCSLNARSFARLGCHGMSSLALGAHRGLGVQVNFWFECAVLTAYLLLRAGYPNLVTEIGFGFKDPMLASRLCGLRCRSWGCWRGHLLGGVRLRFKCTVVPTVYSRGCNCRLGFSQRSLVPKIGLWFKGPMLATRAGGMGCRGRFGHRG